MKKFTRWALCLGLCLALLVCVALADEAPGITVQLDGQALTFTDAVPQVKDQRTFLPFRAVFEAMGAQVDYEGSVITAVRGDKTLTMTLDQTTATVTEKGVTTPITMDVAPYVDPATWRTYVPVRFAAQAFDCVVGWDQEAQTAIVIDTETLLTQTLEGKSFTYLEKLGALSEKYDTGIWDITATFDADVSMFTIPMLTMNGDVRGTIQDSDKVSVDMNMKMDISGMMSTVGEPLTDEEQAVMDALKADGVDLTMRGEVSTGKLYMNMDLGALNADANVDSAAWYELDMAAIMEQAGMKWADVMTMSQNMDMLDAITALLATAEPTDAATAYADIKALVEEVVAAFCDEGFVQEDGQYVATYAEEDEDGSTVTLVLVLDMEGESLKGYVVGVDVAGPPEDELIVDMSMTISMDDQNNMSAEVVMDADGLMTMSMTMDGAYTPGTAAPVTTPPAGATVIPFTELMGNDAGLGVIDGADGPTSTVVTVG